MADDKKPLPQWMYRRPMSDREFTGVYCIGMFCGIMIGLLLGWAIWDNY